MDGEHAHSINWDFLDDLGRAIMAEPEPKQRRCKCGTILSIYNPKRRCFCCQKPEKIYGVKNLGGSWAN